MMEKEMVAMKHHYGWLVAVSCGLLLITSLLFGGTMITTYTVVIADDLGISRSAFSVYPMIRNIVAFGGNLCMFQLIKWFKLKTLIVSGVILTITMLLVLSFSNSLAVICFSGVLGGMANTFTAVVPTSIIITNWFHASRGVVLGLVTAASGIGGVLVSPVMSRVVVGYGWRVGFRGLAVVCLMILIIIVCVLKETPEEIGMRPYGFRPEKGCGKAETEVPLLKITGKSAESRNLRSLLLICILFTVGTLSIYVNLPAVLQETGFPLLFATGVAVSAVSLANCAGKFIMGQVNDKVNTEKMLVIWYGLCFIASVYFVLYRGNSVPVALTGVLIIGFTGGIYSVPIPLAAAKLFTEKAVYSQVMSYCAAAASLSTAVSGIIFHGFYDIAGSYVGAMLFVSLLSLICFVMVKRLISKNKRIFDKNGE